MSRRIVLIAAALAILPFTGCAVSMTPQPAGTLAPPPAPRASAAIRRPAAASAARRYALAARTWTPDTYAAQYRTQLRLSVGELRAALRTVPPTAAQLAQLKRDQSAATAQIVSLTPIAGTASTALYEIRMRERMVLAGDQTVAQTTNRARVRAIGASWRVEQFTVMPTADAPP